MGVRHLNVCFIVILLLSSIQYINTISIDFLYPHGAGIDTLLAKGFEVSSERIQLNVPIKFYGQTYEGLYVNTKGLLSFDTDIPIFINVQFPLDYAVIAPLYTNIDTRTSGFVSYRETNDSGILYRFNINIHNSFSNSTDFEATSVFIATWYEVGYYANQNDKVNTFQVAIGSNGNNSYVTFLYPDTGIQWIQAQRSESGLPDARAQAGFISHEGQTFLLKGSGTDQITNINKLTNTNLPGLWMFHITNEIEQPDNFKNELPTPTAKENTCSVGYITCHSKARCVDLEGGFCCVCNDGYFGNGKTCLKNDIPIRVIGKVSGTINGEPLSQLDLHSYIVMPDGRAYTAISRIPPIIGNDMPSLNVIGRVISWLVAKRTGGVKNGYELTGGVFNHTATLTFPKTGDKVKITNRYHGLDVFDQLRLETEIIGTIPPIPPDAKVSLSIIVEEFNLVEKGRLESRSDQVLKLNKDSEKIPYHVEQTFTFDTCPFEDPTNITVFKMKTSKIFIKFENTEKIIRYGTSSKLVPLEEEDPCLYGMTTCGENSYCLVEGDSFRCICEPGYQEIYDPQNNVLCVDVNECSTGTHYCDKNARCLNEEGSFTCECNPGYRGDGRRCELEEECSDTCDMHATCVKSDGYSRCECNPGFTGNGLSCKSLSNDNIDNGEDCRTLSNCSPYGECVEIQDEVYGCECLPGYIGDGVICNSNDTSSPTEEYLSQENDQSTTTTEANVIKYAKQCSNGQCWCPAGFLERPNYCIRDTDYVEPSPPTEATANLNEESEYARPIVQCLDSQTCFCPSGYYYTLNSSLCIPYPGTVIEFMGSNGTKKWQCNVLNNCHPEAQCVYIASLNRYQCQCNADYEGDGFECVRQEVESCREAENCGENGECVFNPEEGIDICVCLDGFVGDGYTCLKEDDCSTKDDCGPNAECVISPYTQKYECMCMDGFALDKNGTCQYLDGTCGGGTCKENAECLYDNNYKTYYCQCNSGYIGDGINECRPQPVDCSVQNNCGLHGYCEYDLLVNGYICKCEFGFFGDGYNCRSENTCEVDPYICDQYAKCILGPESKYVCQCSDGFIGNGSYCKPAPKLDSGFLLASQQIATLRIPFNANRRNRGKTINVKANQFAIAIDIDCTEGRVYWSDIEEKKIKSSAYDGSEFNEFLISGIGSPEGISIDWVSRNIFWADTSTKTIEVANLETKLRKILFSQNVINPRGVAVHPYRGKIFWSDWNRLAPKIEWANMDGTGRGIFLKGNSVLLPNSLAIDWQTDQLCYADAGTQKIECVNIDTRVSQTITSECKYPFGLAITPSHFYWTDWQTLKIESVDRATLTERKSLEVPLGGFTKLYGLVAVPERCPPQATVCQFNNGNCSPGHICLPNGKGGRTCVCVAAEICNDV